MRYIANAAGRVLEVSFGADIQCGGRDCTQYIGAVPAGYDSLMDWFTQEADKLYRWHIVDDQLTLDEDAKDPKKVDPYGMTLLWENASPTSVFSAQTIALNLNEYDAVMLTFNLNSFVTYTTSFFVKIGRSVFASASSASSGNGFHRVATASANGITFEDGYELNHKAVDNSVMCPLEIYGIKGVQEIKPAVCGTFVAGELNCGQ